MATDTKTIHLIDFADDQLLFTEEETRAVLIFFFPVQAERTRALVITNQYRNFAQGLLVAAVDATYALNVVGAILRAFYVPPNSIRSALSKLGRAGAGHWFKYAKGNDLHNPKIADTVRQKISWQFAQHYQHMWEAKSVPIFHAIHINPAFC